MPNAAAVKYSHARCSPQGRCCRGALPWPSGGRNNRRALSQGARAHSRVQAHRAGPDRPEPHGQHGHRNAGAPLRLSAKTAGCHLELVNLGKQIREILGLTNLLSIFTDMCEQGVTMRF